MRRHGSLAVALASSLISISGCSGSPGEDESRIGAAPEALLTDNALNLNALNLNALNLNALNLNALNLNALDAGALAAIQDPGANGALSRQLLQYAASCALDSTQSFAFSWTDGLGVVHHESYPGLLGLATNWPTHSLNTTGEQWVSACLVSRANYFGVPVSISAHGGTAGLVVSDPSELAAYANEEGAFWGDLFTSPPSAYACDVTTDDANSRARNRVCAAGYVDGSGNVQSCGIITRLGSCDTYCTPLTGGPTHFHANCGASHGAASTHQVVTIFLQ